LKAEGMFSDHRAVKRLMC